MISDEQLEEWERLAREATEGEWVATGRPGLGWWVNTADGFNVNAPTPDGEMTPEDARFVAASRTAVPALIAEVRRLREQVARARKIANASRPRHDPAGIITRIWRELRDDATVAITSGRVRLPGDASDDEETKA